MSDAGNNTSALLAELLTLPGERRLARVRESLGEFASESTKVTDALVSLGDEAERLAVVEVSRALSASELSVSLADEANAPRARARARRARGQALAYAGRFDEALGLCAEAERIATAHGETIEAARAKLASMHALTLLDRYEDAIQAGEQARQAFMRAGRLDLAARADINLGKAFQNRDEPQTALVHLDRARASLSSEPFLLGHIEVNRGEALLALSDFVAAESAFLVSLRIFEESGMPLAAAVAEGNLAELAARQGQLQRSLHHFERARARLESSNAAGHLARLLSEQAEIVGTLGLTSDAIVAYQNVMPKLREHGLHWEEARAQAGLGRCLLMAHRTDEAEAQLRSAAQTFSSLKSVTWSARVAMLLAEIMEARGDYRSASALLTATIVMVRDRPVESLVLRSRLAGLSLRMGDVDAAAVELASAIPLAEKLDIAPLLSDLLHARGQLHVRNDDSNQAIADFSAAVAATERVRGSLHAERMRAAYLGNRLAPYESLVRAILNRGGAKALSEAFAVIEKVKSRALLDLLRGALDEAEQQASSADQHAATSPDILQRPLLAELAQLRRDLNALYSKISPNGRSGERRLSIDSWQQALHEREAAVERLQTRLSSMRGVRRLGISELYSDPVPIAEAVQLTGGDGALVEYFVAGEELMAFVITRSDQVVVRELGTRSELHERVARVQFQLRRSLRHGVAQQDRDGRLLSDIRRELHLLWRVVFAPLAQHVADASRLLIVPHGPLHLIPFHALWDGQRFLIEQHEFVYGPSASVLAHARATDDDAPVSDRRPLVIGVADELAPHIDAEARLVARILDARQVLLNSAATTDAFFAAARDAKVIHLACHGRFSSTTPLSSGLRLSDRWLTAREIYGLRLNADLVTLSGCETGRHLVASGDEILGLVRGFLAAGASSLLVSLWSAHDESTTEMMVRFYQLWHSEDSGGPDKAGALRLAQLEALARRPHPASWASFVLVGKP